VKTVKIEDESQPTVPWNRGPWNDWKREWEPAPDSRFWRLEIKTERQKLQCFNCDL